MAVVPSYYAKCTECKWNFVPLKEDGHFWQDDFGADKPVCPKCKSTEVNLSTPMGILKTNYYSKC